MEGDHRLVIVGGGVAGLDVASHLAAKRVGNRRLSITLIDRETAYVWKPMLHTIAAGTSDAGAQQTVYAAQALSRGFHYELGEAISVDRHRQEIRIAPLKVEGEIVVPERTLPYDTLVLAVGSKANDFGTPGVLEHCAQIDTRSEAIHFSDRLRAQLVKSSWTGDPLKIGIVGGGATGVELAAELVRVAAVAEQYGLAGTSNRIKIALIESGPRLLGPFPEKIADAASAKLKQLGVEVHTRAKVTSVNDTGFRLDGGQTISAALKVWAAGVKAPPLLDTLADLPHSRQGQLIVGPTLMAAGDPHIFALGDCASPQLPGRTAPVPTTAQAANQQARYLCKYLPRLIAGEMAPPDRKSVV